MSVPVDKSNREAWEARAKELGVQLSSVLCRGLPPHLNSAMDGWHRRLLHQHFLGELATHARVLDGGCGYGRVSQFLHETRPDLQIVGCDLAHAYCLAFTKFVGAPAICMTLEKSPFAPNTFDGVVAINALMYLDPARRTVALQQLRESLVPGGKLFLLEPGLEFFNLLARIGFDSPTAGQGFSLPSFRALAVDADLRLLKSGSALAFSGCLPLLALVSKLGFNSSGPIDLALRWDARRARLFKWSAYRWQLLQRL